MAIEFTTDEGSGARARLGLVVLQSDETLEPELARLARDIDGVAVHHTRIPSAPQVTPESLAAQHKHLSQVVGLLPVGVRFDVVGYGCTSGATIIGEQAVAQAVHRSMPGVAVTNPLTALKAACATMGIKRLGLITPYTVSVTRSLEQRLVSHGITIVKVDSFDQESEAVVARITPGSILQALRGIGSGQACDAWFVSCTNLRMATITSQAEQILGVPVLSSNQVLAWHMLRLAGVNEALPDWGSLWQQ